MKMEELIRIANLLKIPIEKIITFPEYIEVISGNQNIGSLPFINVSSIIRYDASDAVLSRFRWNFIYSQNTNQINPLIYDLLNKEEDEIEITIGGYRNLYVKDNAGNLICGITCSFINGQWTIERRIDL
jgi:hypothetical protein